MQLVLSPLKYMWLRRLLIATPSNWAGCRLPVKSHGLVSSSDLTLNSISSTVMDRVSWMPALIIANRRGACRAFWRTVCNLLTVPGTTGAVYVFHVCTAEQIHQLGVRLLPVQNKVSIFSSSLSEAPVSDEHLDFLELPFKNVTLPREIYRHLFVKAGGPASALDVWLCCRSQDRWHGLGSVPLRLSALSRRCFFFSLKMPFIIASSIVVPSTFSVFETFAFSRISWAWDLFGMMYPFWTLPMLSVFPSMILIWFWCSHSCYARMKALTH